MKIKLTTLLFGLLLAVGWTSSALAQEAAQVPSAVHNKAYYQQFTYSWTDEATGETHNNVDPTEPATNPYQMYELIRFVYGNPNFPGPKYSAYTPNLLREDEVYYGPIAGGWDITQGSGSGDFVQGTVVAPKEEGYTVLVVALKDYADSQLETEIDPSSSTYFTTKAQLISYFDRIFASVRLLTDGLRVGQNTATVHTSGTVFNCDGRYNRFFFIGKGQARKKAPRILDRIANHWSYTSGWNTYTYQDWWGEDVPFKTMFEQFSPTDVAVSESSQTFDFFDKMREGNIYGVQHDCGSVTQAKHEFSLSGRSGTEYFPFSGLNIFIPDFRLLFWTCPARNYTNYTADGRDNLPYEQANQNYTTPEGSHGSAFINSSENYSAWSAYYAVYHTDHQPKIGIYKITLDATAQPASDYSPTNRYYDVTLTWVSSLNEMSGHIVPQTYTVYLVDENGNQTKLNPENVVYYDVNGNVIDEPNPFSVTQVIYKVPQDEHSYTIEYIVHGTPDAGPTFEAWSNRDGVVIPGWNDFVGLVLDHHESDFVITKNTQTQQSSDRRNWYRNFLAVVNEDIYNGLTVSRVSGADEELPTPMNEFNLYRFLYNDQNQPLMPGTKIATVKFDQANAEQVHYKVTYEDGQQILADKYQRSAMEVPDEGWVRVKGNGDLVIWPNGYYVNIKSITIKNGNQTLSNYSWNANSANVDTDNPNLPGNWACSPGSKFMPYVMSTTNEKVCYMEGGGYLYYPNLLDTYPNLTVEITACNDGSHPSKIAVNDVSKDYGSTMTTQTWGGSSSPVSPAAAPMRDQTVYYEKVENIASLTSGEEYLIVCEQNNVAFNGALTDFFITGNNNPNNIPVTISDGRIESNETVDAATFTITAATGGYYTIKSKSGYYIGNASTSTGVSESTSTAYNNSISIDADGNANVRYTHTYTYGWSTNTVNHDLKYNYASNQQRFAYTTSTNNYRNIQLYKKVVVQGPAEGGLLRLHLVMVDQLNAQIPDDNSHPDAYGYVLKWEQPASAADYKQSGSVRVNIQKTDCEVMGYYTLDQIDADTIIGINHDEGLTMDVLNADVEFNLSSTNDLLDFYNLQTRADQDPNTGADYVTKLQRQDNFTYREMLETSPHLGDVYQSGEHHYFDGTAPIKTGIYDVGNKFMSFAPSVSTWGIQRRYYEDDDLDNTYGGPIWKTAVGKVEMNQDKKPIAERQTNNSYSVNWTDQGGDASLFILDNVSAIGYLPPENLTKVKFEPYMFRIFVESKNGMLRPYKTVEAGVDPDKPGEHLAPADGELTEADMKGPKCVWSGYLKRNATTGAIIDDPENGVEVNYSTDKGPFTYTKKKVDRTDGSNATPPQPSEWDKDANNAMFGALDAIIPEGQGNNLPISEDDLKIFVRFYFCVKGEAAGHTVRGEGSRSGNGAESGGSAAGSATSVNEIQFLGEIVSQTYYNVQGVESDKPFDGINIVVTRFSNGTTSVSKVVR